MGKQARGRGAGLSPDLPWDAPGLPFHPSSMALLSSRGRIPQQPFKLWRSPSALGIYQADSCFSCTHQPGWHVREMGWDVRPWTRPPVPRGFPPRSERWRSARPGQEAKIASHPTRGQAVAGSAGLTLSAPCLTWPVPKQKGVIPNPSEVSPSCLLLSLDLSRIMRMVEFAYGVFCGQGRKTRWTQKNLLVLCLPVSQAALRDGGGDGEDIGLGEIWS